MLLSINGISRGVFFLKGVLYWSQAIKVESIGYKAIALIVCILRAYLP